MFSLKILTLKMLLTSFINLYKFISKNVIFPKIMVKKVGQTRTFGTQCKSAQYALQIVNGHNDKRTDEEQRQQNSNLWLVVTPGSGKKMFNKYKG